MTRFCKHICAELQPHHTLSNIPSYDPALHIVQDYAAYPDYIDFLQQHGYVLAAGFAGGCLHQNTHENCKYETNINTLAWSQSILTRSNNAKNTG